MTHQRLRLSGGTEVSFLIAGEPSKPALLLLHGTPNTARMFEGVIPPLAQAAYVIAPDLPGFGESDVLSNVSFVALGVAIAELLDKLSIGPRYVYLHDWGAPVGLHVAMQAPSRSWASSSRTPTRIALVTGRDGRQRKPFGPIRARKTKKRRPRT